MPFDDLKYSVRKYLRQTPREGRYFISTYRLFSILLRRVKNAFRMLFNRGLPHPENVYWISPKRIVFHTNYMRLGDNKPPKDRVFHPQRDRGKVYSGSWDLSEFRFDELDVVRAIRDRVENKIDWKATLFYSKLVEELDKQGSTSWGIRTVAELDARCNYIDRLIESMQHHGYRLSHQVRLRGEDKGTSAHPYYGDEISVNIGRDGHYLFQDGRHRLAIAKILGVPQIPVKVLVRHSQWVEFRYHVKSLSHRGEPSSPFKALCQNPIHPDLQDIPYTEGCEERFNAIANQVVPNEGSLLDIGSNLGFFCHRFEELGYNCFAVESQKKIAMANERIRVAEGKKFSVIADGVFSAMGKEPLCGKKFDIVLALKVFQHFIKDSETYHKFVHWLGELNTEVMFFEPHLTNDHQMINPYQIFQEQELVEFIIEKSILKHFRVIHRCKDGQPLYMLW